MDFWMSFREDFLTGGQYENLGSNSMISVPWIIVGLFLGIAVAFIATVFTKRVLGELVRKLLAESVLSSEEAKTLSELSLDKNVFLRHAVKGNVALRRVVRCREEDAFWQAQENEEAESSEGKNAKKKRKKEKPFRVDPDAHHFYIPEECKDMAAVKFNKKGTSIGTLILLLVILLIALLLLLLALPRLMELLDDFAGVMKNAAASSNDKIV